MKQYEVEFDLEPGERSRKPESVIVRAKNRKAAGRMARRIERHRYGRHLITHIYREDK